LTVYSSVRAGGRHLRKDEKRKNKRNSDRSAAEEPIIFSFFRRAPKGRGKEIRAAVKEQELWKVLKSRSPIGSVYIPGILPFKYIYFIQIDC